MEALLGLDRCKTCFGRELTRNARVLIVYIVLFATITSAQFVVSLPQFANSLALRADCLSMLVDTITYTGNLVAEMINGTERTKRAAELITSGFSLLVLVILTGILVAEASETIQDPEDEGDVGVYYVLAFALLGLLFDGSGLAAFAFCPEDGDGGGDGGSEGGRLHTLEGPEKEAEGSRTIICGMNINMLSAMAHLLSDLFRSTTTLIEAILIISTNVNGALVDGWSAMVICILIFLGAAASFYVWGKEVYQEYRERDQLKADLLTSMDNPAADDEET